MDSFHTPGERHKKNKYFNKSPNLKEESIIMWNVVGSPIWMWIREFNHISCLRLLYYARVVETFGIAAKYQIQEPRESSVVRGTNRSMSARMPSSGGEPHFDHENQHHFGSDVVIIREWMLLTRQVASSLIRTIFQGKKQKRGKNVVMRCSPLLEKVLLSFWTSVRTTFWLGVRLSDLSTA